MRKKYVWIIFAFILVACAESPTAPPGAVDIAVAQILAAWTAEAPALTNTPVPTGTALPTTDSSDQTGDDILLPERLPPPHS
ncbi:MAG: hypothetical protein P8Y14_26785 [Anaerolineales bacterium]|jgi:hypothetical protein